MNILFNILITIIIFFVIYKNSKYKHFMLINKYYLIFAEIFFVIILNLITYIRIKDLYSLDIFPNHKHHYIYFFTLACLSLILIRYIFLKAHKAKYILTYTIINFSLNFLYIFQSISLNDIESYNIQFFYLNVFNILYLIFIAIESKKIYKSFISISFDFWTYFLALLTINFLLSNGHFESYNTAPFILSFGTLILNYSISLILSSKSKHKKYFFLYFFSYLIIFTTSLLASIFNAETFVNIIILPYVDQNALYDLYCRIIYFSPIVFYILSVLCSNINNLKFKKLIFISSIVFIVILFIIFLALSNNHITIIDQIAILLIDFFILSIIYNIIRPLKSKLIQ